MSVPSGYRLLTLGTLRLVGPDGRDEPSLLSRRRKLALLALLAVTQRPMSRDRLVALFWGEQNEERARHSLSDALSSLRRALGPNALNANRSQVALDERLRLSVDLRELAEAASAREWTRVIALHEAPFLDGVPIGGSSAWEQWVLAQRSGAARLFETACHHESERLASEGSWAALERVTARWLAQNPADAAAGRWHLTAIARRDPTDASTPQRLRDAFDLLTHRLEADLGTQPAAVVRAARDTLLTELVPAPVTVDVPMTRTASEARPSGVPDREAAPVDVHPSARPRHRRWRRWAAAIPLATAAIAGLVLTAGRSRADGREAFTLTSTSAEARALVERASTGEVTRNEALELLERALGLDGDFAMAHRARALLLEGDGTRSTEVAAALERAVASADRATPFERALILSSYHLLVTGDYSRASAAQRELLRLAPHDGDAWHDLGMTYQYLGDEARAAEAYREALAGDPSSASTWANLIDALYASADSATIDAALDSMARAIPGHVSNFSAMARVRMARGDWAGAEEQARAYLASVPDVPRVQGIGELLLSRAFWGAGQLGDGDASARRGIAWWLVRGDTAMALRETLAMAMIATWRHADPEQARRILRDALARYPLDAIPAADRPALELATVQALIGEWDEATRTLAEYERTVAPIARRRAAGQEALARGTLALSEGRIGEAEGWLRQAARPDCHGCGLPELGLALEARGDSVGARARYQRFLALRSLRRTDLLDALHREWVSARLAGRPRGWSPIPRR